MQPIAGFDAAAFVADAENVKATSNLLKEAIDVIKREAGISFLPYGYRYVGKTTLLKLIRDWTINLNEAPTLSAGEPINLRYYLSPSRTRGVKFTNIIDLPGEDEFIGDEAQNNLYEDTELVSSDRSDSWEKAFAEVSPGGIIFLVDNDLSDTRIQQHRQALERAIHILATNPIASELAENESWREWVSRTLKNLAGRIPSGRECEVFLLLVNRQKKWEGASPLSLIDIMQPYQYELKQIRDLMYGKDKGIAYERDVDIIYDEVRFKEIFVEFTELLLYPRKRGR